MDLEETVPGKFSMAGTTIVCTCVVMYYDMCIVMAAFLHALPYLTVHDAACIYPSCILGAFYLPPTPTTTPHCLFTHC